MAWRSPTDGGCGYGRATFSALLLPGALPALLFGMRAVLPVLFAGFPLLLNTVGGFGAGRAPPLLFGTLPPLLLSKTVGGRGTERPFGVVSATLVRPFCGPATLSFRCGKRDAPAGFPAPTLAALFLPLLNGEAGADGGVMLRTGCRANACCGGIAAARPALAPRTLVRLGSAGDPPITRAFRRFSPETETMFRPTGCEFTNARCGTAVTAFGYARFA